VLGLARRAVAALGVVALVCLASGAGGPAHGRHRAGGPPRPQPNRLTAGWVRRENAKPGSLAWEITTPQTPTGIEGYANRVSVDVGQPVTLYVSTQADSFKVQVFRMGWYQGDLARLVWTSPSVPGKVQPSCPVTRGVNMVECSWQPSTTIAMRPSWPQGDYLFKLVGSGGQESLVPLTVRDDQSRAPFAIQNSVTTWQAYNLYGGYDLYSGETPGGGGSFADRSREVSFDRPYAFSFGAGSADFLGNELPLVALAERLSLNVTYWTDIDFAEHPQLLLRHRALISLGHDEYWSDSMRLGAITGIEHGVNLAFLGANAMFRHIRLSPSPLGPDRREINYKSFSEDPISATDPAEATNDWPDPPDPRPESEIEGDMYGFCSPVTAPMVFVDASSWIMAGTGLADGSSLPGLVGSEFDRYSPQFPSPTDVQILAHSPLTCQGRPSTSDMTYYTAPSGAGVFDTGTNVWVASLGNACPASMPGCPYPATVRITENVLRGFGAGPAGRRHPSVANATAVLGPDVPTPTPPPWLGGPGGAPASGAQVPSGPSSE
jgi:hypothetical protein